MRHCLIALLALPLLARAAPAQDQWFTVLLDGRKIGSFESKREVRDAQVITLQKLDMTLDRAGSRVALSNAETSIETADGTPLAFRSVSKLSGSQTTIQGTRKKQMERLHAAAGQLSDRADERRDLLEAVERAARGKTSLP